MKSRNLTYVLRIHSSKKKHGHEEYYAALHSFYPWKEEDELHPSDPETRKVHYKV